MSEASAGSVIIDRIYALLPAIDDDVDGLRGRFSTADKVEVFQAAAIFDAVELLIGFGYRNRLGLSANDLAKFEAIKGQVSAGVLMKVGVRAKALLKELEGEVARDERQSRPDLPPPTTGSPPSPAANLSIRAVGWVALDRSDNAALIADIARLIEDAMRLSRGANLPKNRQALTDIERAQLIAILETALLVLKAPQIEKGLIAAATKAARSGAERAAAKGTELALGYALGKLAELLVALGAHIGLG